MFKIGGLFDNVEQDESYDITFESDCCSYTRESDILDAIAEYERMNEWD